MRNERDTLRQIFDAALEAVAPDKALLKHVQLDEDGQLYAGGRRWQLAGRRLHILGAGKGVAPMARAVEMLLGDTISTGLVVTKYGHTLPLSRIEQAEAGHPVPDDNGVSATSRLLALAHVC
ncbi:MAG: DUF4147 domain-containing protein, partial [Desulfovibrionaceae bacterium]|nr:DUF4147 domain-containing protein [Desulfovibrionaceae bacterium]